MKINSKFFKEHMQIIKQDSDHYWVICHTIDGNEYRYCSDNVQFCRRCMSADDAPQSKSNGVSYPFAAMHLWNECLASNGVTVINKVRRIKNLNDLCKAMNANEPIDLQKIYNEHPEIHDIPDPESRLICHDGKRIILMENGKCSIKIYNAKEVERYFEQLKKSDL